MPLDSLHDHIDFIINQIKDWKSSDVVYPVARKNLMISENNYVNGLKIIKNMLAKTIIKPARKVQETIEKSGTTINIEDVIRKYWSNQVIDYYNIVERFNLNFNNQTSSMMPFEIYYWIQSILDELGVPIPTVLEASNQFTNHSFNETIIDPLSVGLEIGAGSIIPGSLEQVDVSDVLEGYKILDGYIISFIRGEFRNILLWPILVHESFHILDREKNLVSSLSAKNEQLPTLSDNKVTNFKWTNEIIMDILAAKYFGPMYLSSLVNYYERLPYIQTLDHPEMALRLRAVQEYLNTTEVQYTDIFDKCKNLCFELTGEKIKDMLKAGEFSQSKENRIITIYQLVSKWFESLNLCSFRLALKHYQLQSKSKSNEKTFTDPLYTLADIANLFFDNEVPLAIDPRIVLNVVMAEYSRYNSEKHFEILTDGILKWRIRKEWNKVVGS